jgi:hypothetical protein
LHKIYVLIDDIDLSDSVDIKSIDIIEKTFDDVNGKDNFITCYPLHDDTMFNIDMDELLKNINNFTNILIKFNKPSEKFYIRDIMKIKLDYFDCNEIILLLAGFMCQN